jgi:hypothetical protein
MQTVLPFGAGELEGACAAVKVIQIHNICS